MKKNILLAMWLAIAGVFTTMTMSACSDDEENNSSNGGGITIEGVDQAEYFRKNLGLFTETNSLAYPLFMTAVDKLKPTEYTYYVEDEKAAEQTFLSWIPEQAQKSVSRDGSTLVYTPRDSTGVAQGTITFQATPSTETATFAVVQFKGVSKIQGIDKIMFQPLSAKPDNGGTVPKPLSIYKIESGIWFWGKAKVYISFQMNREYYFGIPKLITGKEFLEKIGDNNFSDKGFSLLLLGFGYNWEFENMAGSLLTMSNDYIIVGGSRKDKFKLCKIDIRLGYPIKEFVESVDIDESKNYWVCQGYACNHNEGYSFMQ